MPFAGSGKNGPDVKEGGKLHCFLQCMSLINFLKQIENGFYGHDFLSIIARLKASNQIKK